MSIGILFHTIQMLYESIFILFIPIIAITNFIGFIVNIIVVVIIWTNIVVNINTTAATAIKFLVFTYIKIIISYKNVFPLKIKERHIN